MTDFKPDGGNACVRAIERFLIHEADLLDRRKYEEWLGLFTEDCRYWIPLEENQADPKNAISLVYDDRKLLETRVRRLGKDSMHAQAPHSRTLHVIGNLVVEAKDQNDMIAVRSNQIVTEYRHNTIRILAGQVLHRLKQQNDGFRISYKQFNLIDSEGEHRGIPIIL